MTHRPPSAAEQSALVAAGDCVWDFSYLMMLLEFYFPLSMVYLCELLLEWEIILYLDFPLDKRSFHPVFLYV
jgi:hypothetical protein